MKHCLFTLLLAAVLPFAGARADKPAADSLAGAFFPPELVLQARDQIGLSPDQLEALRAQVEKNQPRFDELRQRIGHESSALAALAKQDHVDEAALMPQLDKVLDAERDAKHLQLQLLASIKNLLTPQQQAKLHEIGKEGMAHLAEDARRRLTEKVERVKDGVKKWASSGHDPSEILEQMQQKVKPLLDGGKTVEAEAELDRILEQLK